MKLVVSVINRDDASFLLKKLSQSGFSSTIMPSVGGFLNAENSVVFTGVDEEKVRDVIALIRSVCHLRTETIPAATEPPYYPPVPTETVVAGATVFVMDIEHFERI